ncbi:MAG: SMC-Scp complex subunit ScpB [Candidatus Neomarinimicrobiota bacterium]|nr:MAG: SMC-Scp complex subunit ScpB [Candidatus Neomarinimicrobiota bacterium]
MEPTDAKRIIEALLFATPDPLTQQQVNLVFESDPPNLHDIVELLREEYEAEERPLLIREIAGGYQLLTHPAYEPWVRRLLNKSGKLLLSAAALETLSIIAYKQPISRVEIESIRGVDCSGVLKNLLSKKLIRIKGRASGPGRPLLYGTTDKFLEAFGLGKLSDMPRLTEIQELEESDFNPDQVNVFYHGETAPASEPDTPDAPE